MFSSFFRWITGNKLEKHIWVRLPAIDKEQEIYHEKMGELKTLLCTTFNLIEGNVHEGAGWWEKVEVLKTKNFDQLTLDKICTKECRTLKSPNFPRVAEFTSLRDYTYLPKEVILDLYKAHGRVIGFKPHKIQRDQPSTVVWIHLRKAETTR